MDNRGGIFVFFVRVSVVGVELFYVVVFVLLYIESEDYVVGYGFFYVFGGVEVYVVFGFVGSVIWIIYLVYFSGDIVFDDRGVVNFFVVLDVEVVVFDQVVFFIGRELGDNGEWVRSVDKYFVIVVIFVIYSVRVVVVVVFVVDVVKGVFVVFIFVESGLVVGVWSKMSGMGVGFLDVEFIIVGVVVFEVRLCMFCQLFECFYLDGMKYLFCY